MADRRPLVFSLYRGLARALTPLFNLLFWLRSRSGKELPARKGERFGRSATSRPAGKLVWIHAASVGETVSVLPLVDELTASGNKVLLTTVTVTAAQLAQGRLPEGAIHQFMPFDAPGRSADFSTTGIRIWRWWSNPKSGPAFSMKCVHGNRPSCFSTAVYLTDPIEAGHAFRVFPDICSGVWTWFWRKAPPMASGSACWAAAMFQRPAI